MALLKLLGWVQVMSYEYRYYINDPVEWYDIDSNHQPFSYCDSTKDYVAKAVPRCQLSTIFFSGIAALVY